MSASEGCPEFNELVKRWHAATIELMIQIGKSRNRKLKSAFIEFHTVLGLMIDHLDSHTKRV